MIIRIEVKKKSSPRFTTFLENSQMHKFAQSGKRDDTFMKANRFPTMRVFSKLFFSQCVIDIQ